MKTGTITLSAPRRRNQVVISDTLPIGRKYSPTVAVDSSSVHSKAWSWIRSNCTPRRIVGAMFSARVSTAVTIVVVAAMYWHNLTIDNTIEAQEAVAFDCLLGMPWGLVWAFRASRMPMPEKGGEA